MSGDKSDNASGFPSYSTIGAGNRDLFLEYRNSVLVYCEDEGWEEFYFRFVSRLIGDNHIEDVFCLGGKGALATRLKESAPKDKKRIFLFDKDFDDLLGVVRSSKEIVYLSKYSVENYFIDESLFADFVLDRKKRIRRPEVLSRLDFRERMARFMSWYPSLCRKFVISMRYRLGLPGPKLSVWDFAKNDGSYVESWLDQYECRFLEAVRVHQDWLLEDGKLEAELAHAFEPDPELAWVSDGSENAHFPGKHFLEFFIDVCGSDCQLDDEGSISTYSYLMSSVSRLKDVNLSVLKMRVMTALA